MLMPARVAPIGTVDPTVLDEPARMAGPPAHAMAWQWRVLLGATRAGAPGQADGDNAQGLRV